MTGMEPWEKQKQIMDDPSQFLVNVKGRQVGSTTTFSHKMLKDGLKAHPRRDFTGLIISKTDNQSTWALDKPATNLENSALRDRIVKRNQSKLVLDNGAEIYSLPVGQSGAQVRGLSVDVLYVTEAAFIPDKVYNAVEPMTFATDGKIWLESSPNGTTGRFYRAWQNDGKWTRYRMPSTEAPFISETDIQDWRKDDTSMEFRQEVLGEFVQSESSYFPKSLLQDQFMERQIQPDRVVNNHAYVAGGDFARKGADRTVLIVLESPKGTDRWFVKRIESTEKKRSTDAMGRIKGLDDAYNTQAFGVDENSIGGPIVDTLQEDGVEVHPLTFSQKSKHEMYEALKYMMENDKLRIPDPNGEYFPEGLDQEDVRRLFEQMNQLRYELSRSGLLKLHHPDGGHDDYPDALAAAAFMATQHGAVSQTSSDQKPFVW